MAGEWQEVTLSAIADLSGGFAFKSQDYAPSGRFILRTLNITDDCSISRDDAVYLPEELCPQYARFELKPHDTLFVMVGATLGKVGYVREKDLPALLKQNMWVVRAKQDIADPRFLHYAFRHAVKASLGWASGSARDFVRRDDYRSLQLLAPPLPEQRAIAHILGTLDDKIELNRRMNETLDAMGRAIFKSWFVDFDPVLAKAEGCQPFGMDAETAALFPDSFQDSPLGKIPNGWQVRPIGDVVNAVGGSTPSTEEPTFWNGGISFCTPKDMASLRSPILLHTERRITNAGLQEISSGLLPQGTVLLSSRAPIGYLAITEVPVAVNQGIIAMICDRELPNLYVLHWAKENMHTIVANANGTTFLEISKKNFRPIQAVVPPSPVLEPFRATIEPLHGLMVNNLTESKTLSLLRDVLLPKLISGEIRVAEAERFLGERGS